MRSRSGSTGIRNTSGVQSHPRRRISRINAPPVPPHSQTQAQLSAAKAEVRVAADASSSLSSGLRQRLFEAEEDRDRLAARLKEMQSNQVGGRGGRDGGEISSRACTSPTEGV